MLFSRRELHTRHQIRHHGFSQATAPLPELVSFFGSTGGPTIADGSAQLESEIVESSTNASQNTQTLCSNNGADSSFPIPDPSQLDEMLRRCQQTLNHQAEQLQDIVIPEDSVSSFANMVDVRAGMTEIQQGKLADDRFSHDMTHSSSTALELQLYPDRHSDFLPTDFDLFNIDLWEVGDVFPKANTSGAACSLTIPSLEQGCVPDTSQPTQILNYDLSSGPWSCDPLSDRLAASVGAVARTTLPDPTTLRRYWKKCFSILNETLPFLHEASTEALQSTIALLLACLAIGANHSENHSFATLCFKYSRRLVSECLEALDSQNDSVPLWVVQTILINCVFDEEYADDAVKSADSLVVLARRIDPFLDLQIGDDLPLLSREWIHYLVLESHRR